MEPARVQPAPGAAQANAELAVGGALADRRRALGYTVEDIAHKLKFHQRHIQSLEQGRFDRLPGPTFVRGMIRSYARLLRLDPDPLIEHLGALIAVTDGPVATAALRKPIPISDTSQRVNRTYMVLSLAIAGVIGVVVWGWHDERVANNQLTFVRAPQTPPQSATPPVVPVAAVTPAVVQQPPAAPEMIRPAEIADAAEPRVQSDTRRISLRFERESWVEIRTRDGRILLSQVNPAGSERVVEGRPPFDLVIGNAQNVRLRYDDRPIDLAPHAKSAVARLTLE